MRGIAIAALCALFVAACVPPKPPTVRGLPDELVKMAQAGTVDLDALRERGVSEAQLDEAIASLREAPPSTELAGVISVRWQGLITRVDLDARRGLGHALATIVALGRGPVEVPLEPGGNLDEQEDGTPIQDALCTVTGVTVALDGDAGFSHFAYGYAFTVKIQVAGTNLALCEIRQLVGVTEHDWDYDGNARGDDVLRARYEAGVRPCVNSARSDCVDTGWDWQPVHADGVHRDNQVHNTLNRVVDDRRQVHRNDTRRSFEIQLRRAGAAENLTTHTWAYSWTNWEEARVPDKPYCATDIDVGRFHDKAGCDLGRLRSRP